MISTFDFYLFTNIPIKEIKCEIFIQLALETKNNCKLIHPVLAAGAVAFEPRAVASASSISLANVATRTGAGANALGVSPK